jgi:hypothetical protein
MSDEEIKRGLRELSNSGRLPAAVARAAMEQPIEGEKLLRLDKIERETQRQSLALFGDTHLPGGVNAGIVRDVRELRVIVFRAVWSISGVVAFCTLLITLLGLYIEWSKH